MDGTRARQPLLKCVDTHLGASYRFPHSDSHTPWRPRKKQRPRLVRERGTVGFGQPRCCCSHCRPGPGRNHLFRGTESISVKGRNVGPDEGRVFTGEPPHGR